MNPKTIKVKTLAKGELFACDNISINGFVLDIPSLNSKTQLQSSFTGPNRTVFSGTVTVDTLSALATNLEAYFLKTGDITPTTSPITISSSFANSITPNASATGSVSCLTRLNVSNTSNFSATLLRVLRPLVGTNAEITLTVGTNVNFNSTKFTFSFVVTGSPNTSNYCNLGLSTSSGLRVYGNTSIVTNTVKVVNDFLKPTFTQFSNVSSNVNVSSNYGLTSGPTSTVPTEIVITLVNVVFPNSGELYIQFSGNSSFTQLFNYVGVTRNASDTGVGTPLYTFLAPTGSTSAKPNRGWNQDVQGIPVFIGKFGDTTGNQRTLTSLVLKMYRLSDATPAVWIVTFTGYINSYTMGTSSPPYIMGSGTITGAATGYTPAFFRLKMKDTNVFTNGGDSANNLKLGWFAS